MGEKIILFLTVLAWIGAVLCSIATGLCIFMGYNYPGSTDELLDNLRGVKRTFPFIKWLILAIVCWAFIIIF